MTIQERVREILANAPPPAPELVAGFVALMRGFRREDELEARHALDEDAA